MRICKPRESFERRRIGMCSFLKSMNESGFDNSQGLLILCGNAKPMEQDSLTMSAVP
jgi:hypothetical protein